MAAAVFCAFRVGAVVWCDEVTGVSGGGESRIAVDFTCAIRLGVAAKCIVCHVRVVSGFKRGATGDV